MRGDPIEGGGPCLECRRPYEALTAKSRYFSGACRAAASCKRRDREVREALDAAERALDRARAALRGEEERR
jgi:hypothetical protein